jgi:hypothetical protein
MTKYLLAVLAALTLALAGSGYALKRAYAANGEQAGRIEQLEATVAAAEKQKAKDRALITKHALANSLARAESDRLRAKLDDALTRNREWADQPIPKGVQDALQP